jgi:hypothetical protein
MEVVRAKMAKPLKNIDDPLPPEILPLPFRTWPEDGFRLGPCVKAGVILGGIAGCVSLLMNVIGSVMWPAANGVAQHPLHLIQVFLTFPVGKSALELNSGMLLGLGCLLYLVTGAIYGVILECAVAYFFPYAGVRGRLVLFSGLAIVIWAVNFYGILIWLQPVLFGGRWIVELIPWWVAAVTHLVFGWTMALIYPLGVEKARRGSSPS